MCNMKNLSFTLHKFFADNKSNGQTNGLASAKNSQPTTPDESKFK